MSEDWSSRRLHFIGIGGAGTSGLALIARTLGAQVTGSDRSESSYTEMLREHGIEPIIGHAAANVPPEAEVVYSTAVPPSNPERVAARGREVPRGDLLAEVCGLRRCLAVAGSAGKTTTTAMVVQALRGAGLDPSYVVGGVLRDTGASAGWGRGDWIVVEADESDRSLLELRPRSRSSPVPSSTITRPTARGSSSSRPFVSSWPAPGPAPWSGIAPRWWPCARRTRSATTRPMPSARRRGRAFAGAGTRSCCRFLARTTRSTLLAP